MSQRQYDRDLESIQKGHIATSTCLYWCIKCLGDNWEEYFYPEWVSLIRKYKPDFESFCSELGILTIRDMLHDDTYGYYVNLAGWHPQMDYLTETLERHSTISTACYTRYFDITLITL